MEIKVYYMSIFLWNFSVAEGQGSYMYNLVNDVRFDVEHLFQVLKLGKYNISIKINKEFININ